MKKILIVSSLVIVALVLMRFASTKIGEINRSKAMAMGAVPVVELMQVEEIETSKSIQVPGRVQSPNRVDLIARVDGYLQKKHFKEGDFVKKGQLLLTIEPTQYLNNLNKAKADLENAKAVLYKAQRDYQRGDELVKKDFISKSTYDGLIADKKSAQANVAALSAQVAEAQRNYSYTAIKAPVDGKIGSLKVQEGNYVTIASGALATIAKTNPIYVKYSIDSKQFKNLKNSEFIPENGKEGLKVQVVLPNGDKYSKFGKQDFSDNEISQSTGTMDFRATFENDENILIPGDFVKVEIFSDKKVKSLAIPQNIVLQDGKGKYVYVLDANNCAEQKYFKDNGQYDKYWLVKEGLTLEDKIVATNITKIMPKMQLKTKEEASKEVKK